MIEPSTNLNMELLNPLQLIHYQVITDAVKLINYHITGIQNNRLEIIDGIEWRCERSKRTGLITISIGCSEILIDTFEAFYATLQIETHKPDTSTSIGLNAVEICRSYRLFSHKRLHRLHSRYPGLVLDQTQRSKVIKNNTILMNMGRQMIAFLLLHEVYHETTSNEYSCDRYAIDLMRKHIPQFNGFEDLYVFALLIHSIKETRYKKFPKNHPCSIMRIHRALSVLGKSSQAWTYISVWLLLENPNIIKPEQLSDVRDCYELFFRMAYKCIPRRYICQKSNIYVRYVLLRIKYSINKMVVSTKISGVSN
ncbi:MAG: hypothetical protein CVU48_01620 [Candidatus Cloacimonetes bacterium HGW-Cloacimonetes-1]|jgi:hypothetical protein|nr:MAG: hypothetical protein CVU48_01620 [Candidatus Cloacimonetes bacterium HGW-Cloacimonetes-1]